MLLINRPTFARNNDVTLRLWWLWCAPPGSGYVHNSVLCAPSVTFRYRVAEIQYHRVSSLKNRIESVLLFVPDVWSCIPTTSQWETIVESYLRLADDKEAEIKASETDFQSF